jgi:hypothetical protein
MKDRKAILGKIKELKNDPRMKPVATVFENAPKALIQCNQEGMISALKWVLKD